MSSQNNVVTMNSEAVLMNKLSEPETIAQLITLLDNLEKFNELFSVIEQFISRSPEMADSINRLILALREELPKNNFISNLKKSVDTLMRIQNLINTEEFKKIEETLLNERTLKLVSNLCSSVSNCFQRKLQCFRQLRHFCIVERTDKSRNTTCYPFCFELRKNIFKGA